MGCHIGNFISLQCGIDEGDCVISFQYSRFCTVGNDFCVGNGNIAFGVDAVGAETCRRESSVFGDEDTAAVTDSNGGREVA